MSTITSQIGAIITLLFGIWAICQPVKFSKFVSLTPYKNSGVTEIRATYGGWICGLAIFALLNPTELAFGCLGYGWMGAAIIRSLSIVVDKSYSRKSIIFVIGEIIVGVLLLI